MTRPTGKPRKKAKKNKNKRVIAVLDYETDGFMYGRIPQPFCVEFLAENGTEAVFWGDDCSEQLVNYLEKQEQKYLIYAHNGGKFDFHFLHKYIDNPILIINTRIVECKLWHHTLRDSFAILPVSLKSYKPTHGPRKQEIDYALMEREVREKHKPEILDYLHYDCLTLLDLVMRFIDEFGPQMTIGGTAMRELRKVHRFIKQGMKHDEAFRPFYQGGRVEVFESGILEGPWKLYDVNSMYPSVMRNSLHPVNGSFEWTNRLPDNFDRPFFAVIEAENNGALPSLTDEGNLTFNKSSGLFKVCSHELEVALQYNLVKIDKVHEVYISSDNIVFEEFVDKFFALRLQAKADEDAALDLFYKLILNSAYGRTGINPHNFSDWVIHRDYGEDHDLDSEGYRLSSDHEYIELWERAAEVKESQFCDVAIASSITSASRAKLLQGIQSSIRPIYCDTDSIICQGFTGDMDEKRLGAWKLEKEAKFAAIAGKKMFALYDDSETLIKLSSKGGSLSLKEIIEMCKGAVIYKERDAPTFSIKNKPVFIRREFKMTIDNPADPLKL